MQEEKKQPNNKQLSFDEDSQSVEGQSYSIEELKQDANALKSDLSQIKEEEKSSTSDYTESNGSVFDMIANFKLEADANDLRSQPP